MKWLQQLTIKAQQTQNTVFIYCGIFTKSGLEKLTGINQKQLWHYANGKSLPRRAQVQKIVEALHRLGTLICSVQLKISPK